MKIVMCLEIPTIFCIGGRTPTVTYWMYLGLMNFASLKYITAKPPVRRSQWPRCLRRRSTAARLLRSWVWIPPRAWMSVCCECCVLSGRGLCDELITRPEESYWLWCVVVCDLETTKILVNEEEAKARWGAIAPREKKATIPQGWDKHWKRYNTYVTKLQSDYIRNDKSRRSDSTFWDKWSVMHRKKRND